MLNFTKIKIIIIYFILFLLTSFASLNLFYDENPILKKKVNLGLDLQGGSYLLLEIDTKPLIKERSGSIFFVRGVGKVIIIISAFLICL